MSEILPNLFLCNYEDSKKATNIKLSINCTKSLEFTSKDSLNIRIPVDDIDDLNQNITFFDAIKDHTIFKLVDETLNNNEKVYVYCFAGISRSPSFVVCYIMWKYKINYASALHIVKSKRFVTFIGGTNFYNAMKSYEKLLN